MLKAIVALTRTPQNNLRIFQVVVLHKASTQIKLKEIGASASASQWPVLFLNIQV
jgi:hypothetical protein